MPATALLEDPRAWHERSPVADRDAIYARLPQRHEMALLDGILEQHEDGSFAVAYHDAQPDHFWVRGHLPGRPLMPGVLMLEIAAQLCAYITTFVMKPEEGKFFGFAGVDDVRFRGVVRPGDRMLIAARMLRIRRVFANYHAQGWVDGDLVFEGEILGAMM